MTVIMNNSRNITEIAASIPHQCTVFNIGKTYRMLLKPFERAFSDLGLSSMQFGLLVHISAYQPVSSSELSALMNHDPSTLSRTIPGLVKKDWVSAMKDPEGDGRKRLYTLTAQGESMLEKAVPVWQHIHGTILSHIGSETWQHTLESLALLQEADTLDDLVTDQT